MLSRGGVVRLPFFLRGARFGTEQIRDTYVAPPCPRGVSELALTQPTTPNRNHIGKGELKHWAKHWKVSPEDVRLAIEKVGNAVGAVHKELKLRGLV